MELKQAINLFLGEYQKVTTRRAYAYCLRRLMGYIGPARPVGDISKPLLVEYAQHLERRDLSPASVQKHIKTIKTFFNWLTKLDLLQSNPAKVLKQRRLPVYTSREKAMTDREYEKLIAFMRWNPRHHALLLFLGDTGCRAGGAAGLREQDLDLENHQAIVTEKGDLSRPVVYGDICAQALGIWLVRRSVVDEARYVFSRHGESITADAISQIVRRGCLRVGIRSLGAHSLRHRKGHQLADNHVPVTIAATALGHRNPETTMRHYYPADFESAAVELRKLAYQGEESAKVVRLPVKQHGS